MLRPATPLTVLFFVAFVLLVLATISTPIVKSIHLASFGDVNFGVFGYCTPTKCSSIQVGYSVDSKQLFGNAEDGSDFSLPSTTRSSLSSILIVHPVAALLTLICFILSAVAHLHSPSHSPRYLLGVLILSIPTLLVTLLAFLVDILLFVPHLAWGGWIVLVSTILILASGIVTCAMRRTLVSRKARKKRIAENAEMNGEDFYARQAIEPAGPRAETPPPLDTSGIGQSDKLPQFSTFDAKSTDEDRIPLNQRTPSSKTLPSVPGSQAPPYSNNGYDRYDTPGGSARGGARGGMSRGGRGGYGGPPRDEYGNPLPPSNAFGPVPPAGIRRDRSEPPRLRPQYSDETMRSNNSRGRGRGGYAPRGGYGRGGYPGGNGYGRGGVPMGPMGGEARRGPPPPGYGNGYPPPGRSGPYDGPVRPGQYEAPGGPAGFGRSPSAPAYGARGPSPSGPPPGMGEYGRRPFPGQGSGGYQRGQSPGPPSAHGAYNRGPSPLDQPPNSRGYNRGPSPLDQGLGPREHSRGPPSPLDPPVGPSGYDYGGREAGPAQYGQAYRDERSMPPQQVSYTHRVPAIGQAVEMDALHGCPSPTPASANQMQLRDSDTDVQGFIGLQQQPKHRDSPMSLTSTYTTHDGYVPPRANWTGNGNRGMTPPPNASHSNDPVELPEQNTLRKIRSPNNPTPLSHTRKASDNYYEDVDPRFAPPEPTPQPDPRRLPQHNQPSHAVPSNLVPGLSSTHASRPHVVHAETNREVSDDYEELPSGARSPASDHSNMTSISQRGINPNWRPGSTDGHGRLGVPHRRPVQEQRAIILDANPEFEVPVRGAAGSRAPHTGPVEMGQAF